MSDANNNIKFLKVLTDGSYNEAIEEAAKMLDTAAAALRGSAVGKKTYSDVELRRLSLIEYTEGKAAEIRELKREA